jgi:ATP-binding cassette subfamily B (MDR/TAP) protein 1
MQDIKLIEILVDKSLSLSCDMCPKTLEKKEKMSKVPYASVIGSLMYSMICTHPDISYAIRLVS